MHVYAIFHTFGPEATPELCSLHCTLAQAKAHCDQHAYIGEGVGFGITRVPLYGFPYFLLLIGLLVFIGIVLHSVL